MELFSNIIHEVRKFSFFFPTLAITVRVIKVMISGIEFDRLAGSHAGVFRGASVGARDHRSSRSPPSSEIVSIWSLQNLHGCPQRPNRTQLYSIHAIEVVSVVRVVCDHLGSVSITIVIIVSTSFKKPGTMETIRTIIWKTAGIKILTKRNNKISTFFLTI